MSTAASRQSKPHIRVGDMYFRLADGWAKSNGARAFRHIWQGLNRTTTTSTTTVSGTGSTSTTTTTQDVWWDNDSWAGGEGQTKIALGDAVSEIRFAQSARVDLSNPGQIQLAKHMRQVGLGATTTQTTIEASAFTDLTGSSGSSGTDRRLVADGDRIHSAGVSLNAGTHQVDFYGYATGPGTIEGNVFDIKRGKGAVVNTDNLRLKTHASKAGVAETPHNRTPVGECEATFYVKGNLGNNDKARAHVKCQVRRLRNDGSNVLVGHATLVLDSTKKKDDDYGSFKRVRVKFTGKAGRTYFYRVHLAHDTGDGIIIDKAEERVLSGVKIKWSAYQGTNVLANGTSEVTLKESSVLLASATFTLPSTQTVEFRFERASVDVPVFADKVVYSNHVGTVQPSSNMELGQGGLIWLIDHSSGSPNAYTWNPSTQKWDVVAAGFGAAGLTCIAMTSSDYAEYVLMSNGHVYQIQPNGTVVTYTSAAVSGAVGIVAAASRLWILAESSANGTFLYRYPLDATSAQSSTDVTFSGMPTAGVTPDATITRRMARTPAGPAFFVNRATACDMFSYDDGQSLGKLYSSLPRGFVGRSLISGGGFLFLGGQFPATGGGTRPAVFMFDASTGSGSEDQLGLDFARPGEADTTLQDMQLYGRNLYVLTTTASTPALMRLWRVSLAAPGGLFLEQQMNLASGAARAVAVSALTSAVTADSSAPFLAQATYFTGDDCFLRSSSLDYGTTSEKVLSSITVDGSFPTGTSVEIRYSVNGGDFVSAGVWDAPGDKAISDTDDNITFNDLAWEAHLISTDPAQTPTVFKVSLKALLSTTTGSTTSSSPQTYTSKTTSLVTSPQNPAAYWEIYVDVFDQRATSHIDGEQIIGAIGANYLYHLASSALHVIFEDFYSDPEDIFEHIVSVEQCDILLEGPGEGVARVRLVQRH